jgi:hypothetical protein
VQFSGALYHVTARGDERKPIFRDERDRPAQVRKYLSQYLSADGQARSAWRSATAACALSVLGRSVSPTATTPLTPSSRPALAAASPQATAATIFALS